MIRYERSLILILSENKDSSRNRSRNQGFVASVINATEKYSSIIVQIRNDPLTNLRKILLLEIFNEFIYSNIRECGKNARVNLSTNRVSLNLIENTTPVRKMLVNKFYQDLVIIFNTFCIQDFLETFEELGGNGLSVFSFDSKLDDGTSRVQGFKDFIFVVTGEDESAVASKFLNKRP